MSDIRGFSHGRGGAGNIAKDRSPSAGAQDLITPTLKSDHYTTGRGGSGNMAKNDFGDEARTAQDVSMPVPNEQEGKYHYGRGGANVVKTEKADGSKNPSLLEKGKALLEKAGGSK